MARNKLPVERKPAELTNDEMRRGIEKLNRRIKELEEFDPRQINDRSDPVPQSLQQKSDDTLVEILGVDTIDYKRFCVGDLDRAPIIIGGISTNELQQGFERGKADALSKLRTLKELFEEKLQDEPDSPEARAKRGFEDLQLHPEIARAVAKLFNDGHYANAVEDACKVLDLLVKMRSGRVDCSGTELMQLVFSPKKPLLRFSDLLTESEKSEQQGMMYLYAGAMLAFRNPRAHGLLTDDPEEALEVISFVSFLCKALDRADK